MKLQSFRADGSLLAEHEVTHITLLKTDVPGTYYEVHLANHKIAILPGDYLDRQHPDEWRLLILAPADEYCQVKEPEGG